VRLPLGVRPLVVQLPLPTLAGRPHGQRAVRRRRARAAGRLRLPRLRRVPAVQGALRATASSVALIWCLSTLPLLTSHVLRVLSSALWQIQTGGGAKGPCKCACPLSGSSGCPANQVRDSVTCQCRCSKTCDAPQTVDPVSCQCRCPAGCAAPLVPDGSCNCVCPVAACPKGQQLLASGGCGCEECPGTRVAPSSLAGVDSFSLSPRRCLQLARTRTPTPARPASRVTPARTTRSPGPPPAAPASRARPAPSCPPAARPRSRSAPPAPSAASARPCAPRAARGHSPRSPAPPSASGASATAWRPRAPPPVLRAPAARRWRPAPTRVPAPPCQRRRAGRASTSRSRRPAPAAAPAVPCARQAPPRAWARPPARPPARLAPTVPRRRLLSTARR